MSFTVLQDKRAALMLPTFSFSWKMWQQITTGVRRTWEYQIEASVMCRVNRFIPNSKKALKICVSQKQCTLFFDVKPHVGDPHYFNA